MRSGSGSEEEVQVGRRESEREIEGVNNTADEVISEVVVIGSYHNSIGRNRCFGLSCNPLR
jgi:hypothetical protein